MPISSPVIVALDYPDAARALTMADQLDPAKVRVKVGKEIFTRSGPAVVDALHGKGFEVFLDLKFHDIPNTVAGAVRVIDACFPKILPCECVQLSAASSLREDRTVDLDVALENAGKAVLHFGRWITGSDPYCARDIRCASRILPAGIAQEDRARRDRDVAVFIDFVVRQCGMPCCGGDRVE